MISVCIATYNGEKYIKEQLDSIINQIKEDDEIVISDDNSTDRTLEIINSYKDKRIKIYHSNARNFKKNFENALGNANGDIIFLSDQDDVWIDGKYEMCVSALQKYDLVVTDSTVVDENLNIIYPSFFSYYKSGPGIIKNLYDNTYFGACMAFKRNILEEALPLPQSNEIGHDVWIGLVGEIVGNVHFIEKSYLYYRRHGKSLTNLTPKLKNRSQRPLFTKIIGRAIMAKEVFLFYIRYKLHKICKTT